MALGTTGLRLYIQPSDVIFPNGSEALKTPHQFDHVIAIATSAGECELSGFETLTLEVPTSWAERLAQFFATRTRMVRQHLSLASRVTGNCHAFVDFMGGGVGDKSCPDYVIADGTPLVDTETQPKFGAHLALGVRGHEPPLIRYPDILEPIVRHNPAFHSVVALGDAAPGQCIGVTTRNGFVAIDSLDRIQAYYNQGGNQVNRTEWYLNPNQTMTNR